MNELKKTWLSLIGAVVVLGSGCGGISSTADPSSADDAQAMTEEAIRQVEDQAATAKGADLMACVNQCTQALRTGFGRTIAETRKLIEAMFACTNKCFEAGSSGGIGNGGQGSSCSGSSAVNGVQYQIDCQNGNCSCKKGGVEVMTCQATSAVCSVSATQTGVTAGCCNFGGGALPPVNPNPQPQPQPNPIPPINNGGPGGSCSGSSSLNGVQYAVSCQAGNCTCKKDGIQVMICQMQNPQCSISVSGNGVQAACCKF